MIAHRFGGWAEDTQMVPVLALIFGRPGHIRNPQVPARRVGTKIFLAACAVHTPTMHVLGIAFTLSLSLSPPLSPPLHLLRSFHMLFNHALSLMRSRLASTFPWAIGLRRGWRRGLRAGPCSC